MNAARRPASILALLAGAALLLAGCATAATPAAGGSPTPTDGGAWELEAGWLDGGRQIALVTWGSSTCVPQASDVALQADGTLAVTLTEGPSDRVCTSDYVPRATLVGLPGDLDPAKGLDVVVTGPQGQRGDADLDELTGAVAGGATDYQASAGRVGDDLLAILTWGSSSCAPTIADVAATDAKTVAVTFATPAADTPCTMDMAPRVVLASIAGLGVDDGASVTLSGGDAQFETPVTVPILG